MILLSVDTQGIVLWCSYGTIDIGRPGQLYRNSMQDGETKSLIIHNVDEFVET